MTDTRIDPALIKRVLGVSGAPASFRTLGLVNSRIPGTLTFLEEAQFLDNVVAIPEIAGVITTADLGRRITASRPDVTILESEDPRYDFYALQNAVADARRDETRFATQIDSTAKIDQRAYIAPRNVIIGPEVVIEPNVTVLEDVRIGRGSIIRAGAVLGAEGFEHKRTSRGILSVKHDGEVIVGERVEIGANCAISKGFSYRHTAIGDETRLDNLVHVAHGAQIGKRCFLPAACMIAGSTTVHDDVWIGPNASVSSQVEVGPEAFITIGAVVTKDVAASEHVTGNFAIPHRTFLSILKKNLRDASTE